MLVHGQDWPSSPQVGVTCRCVAEPRPSAFSPYQLKVLLQAGVAVFIPVGGSGLRCAAFFLADGLMGWGCLGFACCCSKVWVQDATFGK